MSIIIFSENKLTRKINEYTNLKFECCGTSSSRSKKLGNVSNTKTAVYILILFGF